MCNSIFNTKEEGLEFLQNLVFPYPVCFEVYICLEYIIKTADILPGDVIVYFSNLLNNHIEVIKQINISKTLQYVTTTFLKAPDLNKPDVDDIVHRY